MEEKPNYYSIIPAEVRYDKELRASEKLLYGEITALAQKTGECWAGNNYFCKLYDVKPNAVATWIRDLKKRGYIKVDYIYNGKEIEKRVIKICDIQKDSTYSQKDRGVLSKKIGGYSQKGEDNNTSINNTSINNISTTTIYDCVEQNFGRTLSPMEYEQISKWEDNELTRYAIKKAVLRNVCSISYISGILGSYERNNIKTVQQAQASDENFKERQEQNRKYKGLSYKEREYLRQQEEGEKFLRGE